MSNRICPYPGLRTFTEEESIYFKGREDNINSAIELIQKNKFLMLTGSSGDGKSSMVFAGIIPQARAGIFSGEFPNWLVIDFKPQRNPLTSISQSLKEKLLPENTVEEIEKRLSLGFSALVDIYKSSSVYFDKNSSDFINASDEEKKKTKRKAKNLLIVVDQFEELYTNPENFTDGVPSQPAKLLINLIIEANKIALAENIPLYVVCTMRSDYFGNCSAFNGLPELMGKSQYFIPRLTRKDIYRAIEDPATLSGNKIEARLVERLLFEVKEGADILPVIQHALFRIWKEYDKDNSEAMDLIHFAKLGGMPVDELPPNDKGRFQIWFDQQPESRKNVLQNPSLSNVLNAHANELYESVHLFYNECNPTEPITENTSKKIIETAFLGMTHLDNGKAVRNRISTSELQILVDIPSVSSKVIYDVIKYFALEENSLIRTFKDNTIDTKTEETTVLDITHEALIRNWKLLGELIKEEAENVMVLSDMLSQVTRWVKENKQKGFLLPEGQYAFFSNWYSNANLSAGWIARFANMEEGNLLSKLPLKNTIDEFLAESKKAVNQKKQLLKLLTTSISVLLVITAVALVKVFGDKTKIAEVQKTTRANEVALKAMLHNDPTIALRIAEEAYKLKPTLLAKEALSGNFMKGPFYMNKLSGHAGVVNKTQFINDSILVSCGSDKSIKIWNILSGKLLTSITDFRGNVSNFEIQNKKIVSISKDTTIGIWTLKGEKISKIRVNSVIKKVTLLNDNRLLTLLENGCIEVYDLSGNKVYEITKRKSTDFDYYPSTGSIVIAENNKMQILSSNFKIQSNFICDKEIKKVKFLSNGTIATYGKTNFIELWSTNGNAITKINILNNGVDYLSSCKDGFFGRASGKAFFYSYSSKQIVTLGESKDKVQFIGVDNECNTIVTVSDNNKIYLWDNGGNLKSTLSPDDITYNASFNSNGAIMATSHNNIGIVLWSTTSLYSPSIKLHNDLIWKIEVSEKADRILTGSWDKSSALSTRSGKLIKKIVGFPSKIETVKFSKNGKYFVVANTDNEGFIGLYNSSDGSLIKQFKAHNGGVTRVGFTYNDEYILSGGSDAIIKLWDYDGKLIKSLVGHSQSISDLVCSKNYIFSGGNDNTAIIWDYSGKIIKRLTNFKGRVYRVLISQDEKLFLTGCDDFSIKAWSKEGDLVKVYEDFTSMITWLNLSNDSKLLFASIGSGEAFIIDLTTDKKIPLIGHSKFANICKFNEKSKQVLTCSDDGKAILWNLKGEILNIFKEEGDGIQDAEFVNDNTIVTGSFKGVLRLWPINSDNLLNDILLSKYGRIYELTKQDRKTLELN